MPTLHVAEDNSSFTPWKLHNDFLSSSFKNSVTAFLSLTCCEILLLYHTGFDLVLCFASWYQTTSETYIHSRKGKGTAEKDRVIVWGCSCSMKANLSSAAQMGLRDEIFKGSCPSPHTAGGLHDQHCMGSSSGQKSSWDRFLKQSWNKKEKGTRQ